MRISSMVYRIRFVCVCPPNSCSNVAFLLKSFEWNGDFDMNYEQYIPMEEDVCNTQLDLRDTASAAADSIKM